MDLGPPVLRGYIAVQHAFGGLIDILQRVQQAWMMGSMDEPGRMPLPKVLMGASVKLTPARLQWT